MRKNPDAVAHGREGFYFGINGECTLYEIGRAIAEKLVSIGKATNPEPSTFTDEEINLYFGVCSLLWLMFALKLTADFHASGIHFLGN